MIGASTRPRQEHEHTHPLEETMTAATHELLIEDVAAVIALAAHADDPYVIYSAVERIAAEALGWRLFTILRYIEAAHAVEQRREGLSGWRP